MEYKSPTIILNPVSGQGSRTKRLEDITLAAKSLGWKGKVIETTPDALANVAASKEYDRGQRHFVVCGGDGTIMEAVGALINKDVVIGIVPLGTGNLLAKNLNLPLEIKDAMNTALNGTMQKFDIGQTNDTYFAIMAGMGLDAQIMRNTNRAMKNVLGLSAYYLIGLTKLLHPPVRFKVSINEETQQFKAKTVLVANMGKFAGQLEAVPNTKPNDGKLKIGVIKARTFDELVDVAIALLKGNINRSKYYTLLEGVDVVIRPIGGPQPYQCDGTDYPPVKELKITIHPQAITMRT